jgi:hypothetical protein
MKFSLLAWASLPAVSRFEPKRGPWKKYLRPGLAGYLLRWNIRPPRSSKNGKMKPMERSTMALTGPDKPPKTKRLTMVSLSCLAMSGAKSAPRSFMTQRPGVLTQQPKQPRQCRTLGRAGNRVRPGPGAGR